MSADDLLNAVQVLVDLESRETAAAAAELLPDRLPVTALLRASDGAQQLARALAARRREADAATDASVDHDPHDVRSFYA